MIDQLVLKKSKHQQNSKQKKQPAKKGLEPVNFFH
jgi:hypothetical protein